MEPEFVVRVSRPDQIIEPIRKMVLSVVPDALRVVISTGKEIVARDIGHQRLGAWFFSGFGLVALGLATISIFGLVAYHSESRVREFGVRLALGATSRDLMARSLGAGLIPVSIGVATGLGLAALTTTILIAWLPGVNPLDPIAFVIVGGLMLGCAAVGALGAAWRLRTIEPAIALRVE
jgi:ABC-type antimicrobial peptide transport system permease subunit